jgi:hypothetical protein
MLEMAVDTSIDEFFDERLYRVLGARPPTAETGSWYPGPPPDSMLGCSDDAAACAPIKDDCDLPN